MHQRLLDSAACSVSWEWRCAAGKKCCPARWHRGSRSGKSREQSMSGSACWAKLLILQGRM